jgi:hypothetical protein
MLRRRRRRIEPMAIVFAYGIYWPTSFVEIGKASKLAGPDDKPAQAETTPPERILKRQSRYGRIVTRLGSWFLYAKNAPQSPLLTRRRQAK